MRKLFTREILIGFVLFLSLAILFLGIDYLKGMNVFKASNIYYVSFSNVKGLTVASPVTLNGMQIGQVTGLEYQYDNPGHILVAVDLDKSVKITKGSKFLLSSSLLGSAELAIDMAQNTEYYTTDDIIEGGAAADFMADISTKILPEVMALLPRLTSIAAHIDTLVSDPALTNTVKRLDDISRNLEVMSAKLASASGQIDPVLSNTKNITENLGEISADLKILSEELKSLPLSETMDNVKTTTDNLAQISTQVNSKDSSLGMLLYDKGLYNHIDSTIMSLDSILIDLRHNPKKYVNFKLF